MRHRLFGVVPFELSREIDAQSIERLDHRELRRFVACRSVGAVARRFVGEDLHPRGKLER